MGELIPIMCMPTMPGDKFRIGCEALTRLAPMVSPVMHRIDQTIHYFFVPNRLVWEGWQDFITNTADPTPRVPPYLIIYPDGTNYTRLMDYMGIPNPLLNPSGSPANENISAIPFAAYQMIYNEYYRDQNLMTEVDFNLIDGANTTLEPSLLPLRMRSWEHDYFTACLPWAQKGAPVDIPLGVVQLTDPLSPIQSNYPRFVDEVGVPANPGALSTDDPPAFIESAGNLGEHLTYDPQGTLSVGATQINDLRLAFRLQEWLEKAARGGSRYIENIKVMFGVNSSDKRLNRPEYITGTKQAIVISEVLQTGESATTPQGNMAGHGVTYLGSQPDSYYCEEHGYIIGIMSVLPKTAYMQGIPKHFLKITDPFEYPWPTFANTGEQEVNVHELYAFTNTQGNTFGYVPRYAEYKFESNRVAGDFRDTLDYWTMARIFATEPALNAAFIASDPTHRIFAVTDPAVHKLYCNVVNKVIATRPLPKFGTPTF